jgi:hypothetical protein
MIERDDPLLMFELLLRKKRGAEYFDKKGEE